MNIYSYSKVLYKITQKCKINNNCYREFHFEKHLFILIIASSLEKLSET